MEHQLHMETQLCPILKKKELSQYAYLYSGVLLVFMIVGFFTPDKVEDFGIWSSVPALFLIVYIFITKRIIESLTIASILAFFMCYKTGWFPEFNASFIGVLKNEQTAWLFIVCGLMGSIITLIERGGGAAAFGEWVAKKSKTRKSTLLWTWVLGVLIFIDDYLNSLTVGSCMAPITDRHKVSREYLAYVVDSTAAPACVLIPISTWAVFMAGLLETNNLAPAGEGVKYFIQTIPYNFYAWFALAIVPLVILGIIPMFGPMKKAEQRSLEEGILAPPGSEKIDINAKKNFEIANPKVMNFFIPILFLIASTIYFDIDMQMGVITTIGFMFVFYVVQGIIKPEEFADIAVKGVINMLFPLIMIVLAFLFAEGNDKIGFIQYVINGSTKIMTPELLPAMIFIVLGCTEFIMGISWGMYIIALPIVIPLAISIGASPVVAVGAVCSAGVWGSHICFYSDVTILTSAATGCDNFRHAITQAPFGFLGAFLSLIAFLIAGYTGLGM